MTTRRRFLTILAGAAVMPAMSVNASTSTRRWKGIALGAEAEIVLDHPEADSLISQAVDEIRRLENIFSLYKTNSDIVRLNRSGKLSNPAFEMVELLSICDRLNIRTQGAFDPTVQALWVLYAKQYSENGQPSAAQISEAMNLTGWKNVEFSARRIYFSEPGTMLTLNGIAQGYIADKVTELFRRKGVANLLVNTGEITALGVAPDGNAWQIRLQSGGGNTVPLTDAAIATSAPNGTTFDDHGKIGHIIDTRTGYPGGIWPSLSVIASSAATADGLSTAFCLMTRDEIAAAKVDSTVIFGV